MTPGQPCECDTHALRRRRDGIALVWVVPLRSARHDDRVTLRRGRQPGNDDAIRAPRLLRHVFPKATAEQDGARFRVEPAPEDACGTIYALRQRQDATL